MTEGRRQERAEAVIIAQEIQTGKLTTLAGLRPCRERAGMNQKELSKAAGICADTYRAWEYGANWPSAFHLAKLATVLGVPRSGSGRRAAMSRKRKGPAEGPVPRGVIPEGSLKQEDFTTDRDPCQERRPAEWPP